MKFRELQNQLPKHLTGDANKDLSALLQAFANICRQADEIVSELARVSGVGVSELDTWGSSLAALYAGRDSTLAGEVTGGTSNSLYLSQNARYDGSDWRYIQTARAHQYRQNAGKHVYRVAFSGTAGNAITWRDVVTISYPTSGDLMEVKFALPVAGATASATLALEDTPATLTSYLKLRSSSHAFNASMTELLAPRDLALLCGGAYNIYIGGAAASPAWGTNAQRVIGIQDGVAPTSSPAGGIQVYSESGAFRVRGSSGGIGGINANGQLYTNVSTGTAPLSVSSTTVVSNLNADLLDGQHASAFLTSVDWANPGTIGSSTPNTGRFTTLTATSTSTLVNVNSSGTGNFQAINVTTTGSPGYVTQLRSGVSFDPATADAYDYSGLLTFGAYGGGISMYDGPGARATGLYTVNSGADMLFYTNVPSGGAPASYLRAMLYRDGYWKTYSTTYFHGSVSAMTNNAGANTATLTNSPVTGNPSKWIAIDDGGVTRYIPAW